MTSKQKEIMIPILDTIESDDIREFANIVLDDIPEYIWQVGASSTGKYHPPYSLGEGGLMRHQIAVVRFLNYFFELDQFFFSFTAREMDLMRVAGLVHDGRKSGEQLDFERSKYTKFDHPMRMAEVIRSYAKCGYIDCKEVEFIAKYVESHMGQFNTDKKTGLRLPKPQTDAQKLVHLADYLASRKDLTLSFDITKDSIVKTLNPKEYVLQFGKYKGEKLWNVFRLDRNYCIWLKENVQQHEVVSMIKQLEAL